MRVLYIPYNWQHSPHFHRIQYIEPLPFCIGSDLSICDDSCPAEHWHAIHPFCDFCLSMYRITGTSLTTIHFMIIFQLKCHSDWCVWLFSPVVHPTQADIRRAANSAQWNVCRRLKRQCWPNCLVCVWMCECAHAHVRVNPMVWSNRNGCNHFDTFLFKHKVFKP